jgi:hypothetical protein
MNSWVIYRKMGVLYLIDSTRIKYNMLSFVMTVSYLFYFLATWWKLNGQWNKFAFHRTSISVAHFPFERVKKLKLGRAGRRKGKAIKGKRRGLLCSSAVFRRPVYNVLVCMQMTNELCYYWEMELFKSLLADGPSSKLMPIKFIVKKQKERNGRQMKISLDIKYRKLCIM